MASRPVVFIRLEPEELRAVDEHARTLAGERGGKPNRSEAIRDLIRRGRLGASKEDGYRSGYREGFTKGQLDARQEFGRGIAELKQLATKRGAG